MPIFRWKRQMEAEKKNNTHSSMDAADQQHCHGILKVKGGFHMRCKGAEYFCGEKNPTWTSLLLLDGSEIWRGFSWEGRNLSH